MIISASYKTDIPTFYGDWFIRRLQAGYCKAINPYGRQVYRVPLDRASVDGFVFWTKNIQPFLRHLPEVRQRGYPFVVQYTINRYPRSLETSVVNAERSVQTARTVADQYGPRTLIWRYDTIVTSSLTPATCHVDNFGWIAERMAGATDEVVISFAQLYKKSARHLNEAAQEHGFTWSDPSPEEKRSLILQLVSIAKAHGMQLTVCSQRDLLVPGAADARCVDAERLASLGATSKAKLKGNRKDCGCFESRDIGDYDTCPHGCVYCYAVQDRALALDRFRTHNPDSEFLFEPVGAPPAERPPSPPPKTLPLFPEAPSQPTPRPRRPDGG